MADSSEKKRTSATTKGMPQHEADAQALREKMARLKELRLAHEAANAHAASPSVVKAPNKLTKKSRKSADKTQSLSDWLTTQQNQGRRG